SVPQHGQISQVGGQSSSPKAEMATRTQNSAIIIYFGHKSNLNLFCTDDQRGPNNACDCLGT
ncbi:hypothetical protein, partial [Xanthomonas sp. SHU 308]|uniref:hypothetical protein n=1 Tax=Xanthomonas sp. SHU 308 TaxID=1591201 RepID=UPI001E435CDA